MPANTKPLLLIILIILALVPVIYVVLRAVVFSPYRVAGSAMEPHYTTGDYLIVNRLESEFQHGDVVVVEIENRPLVLRIVGLPHEQIYVHIDGNVYRDGKIMDEPYMEDRPVYGALIPQGDEYTVPEKHYYVLGDNRDNSYDSRNFGHVHADNIVGKVVYTVAL